MSNYYEDKFFYSKIDSTWNPKYKEETDRIGTDNTIKKLCLKLFNVYLNRKDCKYIRLEAVRNGISLKQALIEAIKEDKIYKFKQLRNAFRGYDINSIYWDEIANK